MTRKKYDEDGYGEECRICGTGLNWSTGYGDVCNRCWRKLGVQANETRKAIICEAVLVHRQRVEREETIIRRHGKDPSLIMAYRAEKLIKETP